jgi:flavodoxin
MHIQVVYSAPFENMQHLAEVIADALRSYGTVRLKPVSHLAGSALHGVDLLVVGCPTPLHGFNPAMRFWLDDLPPGTVQGLPAATFDLTCRTAPLPNIPAAQSLARRLQRAGARLIAPPESFFVASGQADLSSGEVERAICWVHQMPGQFVVLPSQPAALRR